MGEVNDGEKVVLMQSSFWLIWIEDFVSVITPSRTVSDDGAHPRRLRRMGFVPNKILTNTNRNELPDSLHISWSHPLIRFIDETRVKW